MSSIESKSPSTVRSPASDDAEGPLVNEASPHERHVATADDRQPAQPSGQLEERMSRAMHIDTVGILFFRPDGRVTDCNDAFLRMSGVRRDDVVAGRVRRDALTPDEWMPQARRAVEEFEAHGRTTPYEKEYLRPDGTRWWGLFAATRIGPDEGVEYIIDITNRKQAEAARARKEAEFRAMFELSSVGQCQADVESGRILRANRRFCEMLDYGEEELRRLTLADVTHPADRDRARAVLERLLADKAPEASLEKRMVRRDGAIVWVDVNITVMRDAAGVPARVAAIVRDVTAQKGIEQALAESRERLRLILESARDYAILSTDLQRRVTSWNPGAERLTGFTEAEMLGTPADVIFIDEDRARGDAEREAAVALATGRATNERWHQRKDGSRFWGSGAMMPMNNLHGTAIGLVKIFRDETAAREASEALKRSRAELSVALRENERARREVESASRAKDHFLAVLSHELRTPLTPVLMAAQTLALRPDLPDGVRQAVEMIQRNIRIESHFIDDLLDLTRISRGSLEINPEAMDLHEAVREAIAICEPEIDGQGHRLTVDLAAERHFTRGDRLRLQQVAWNVLKNAAKFTPRGGEITVRSTNADGRFVLTVTDTGIGIEPDKLPSIFDAFNQAGEWVAREYGGLGLGLAISKAAIEAHGGSIRAESPGRDRGTTVEIELPLVQ